MSGTLAVRERYRPDGGMKWNLLPLVIAGPFAVAVGVAAFLNIAFKNGFYYVLVLPLTASLLPAGTVYFVLWHSHCRKPFFAACVGLSTGLVAYLGYYHFGLLRWLPPGQVHRVDLLPDYIVFRMKTDVQEMDPQPADNNDPLPIPNPVDAGINWVMFLLELGLFSGVTTFIAWSRARRAYCAEAGQWMVREQVNMVRGTGEQLRRAFEEGDLERFSQIATTSKENQPSPSTCTIEFVRTEDRSPLELPVYLSVSDPRLNSLTRLWPWGRRPRFHQVLLEMRETLALRPLFPTLTAALAVAHKELKSVPGTEQLAKVEGDLHFPEMTTDVAEIAPVPEPYCGRVFTAGHKWMINAVSLVPLVGFFGGIGLAALGVYLLDQGVGWLGTIPLFGLATVGIFIGIAFAFWYTRLPECLYTRWKMLRAIRQRPDPLVDADDPDAISVGITPRENWSTVKLEIASDVGLLKLDHKHSEILIEGDHERFRIPLGSLLICEPECFYHPIDKNTQHWLVRLVVQLEEGTREVLFGLSHTDFKPRNNSIRRRLVSDLCRRIRPPTNPVG